MSGMGTVKEFGGTRAAGEVDTIELELRPEELRALTEVSAHTALASTAADFPAPVKRRDRPNRLVEFGAPIALAVCISAGLVVFAFQHGRETAPRQPSAAAAVVGGSIDRLSPAAAGPPVRFANPFDPGEVFEFAAGTSDAQARDAVAKLLTARARERLAFFVKAKRAHGHRPMSPHTATAQNSARLSMESDSVPERR